MPENNPTDLTPEFQEEFAGAFEEVMSALEATSETFHNSIDQIADAVKGSLVGTEE